MKIIFFCRAYTLEVVKCYPFIDEIICWDDLEKLPIHEQKELLTALGIDVFIHVFPNKPLARLVKSVKIPFRVGTSHRFFHLFTCNIRPNFTRKKSDLHESQLNFKLLKNFGINAIPSLQELIGLLKHYKPISPLSPELEDALNTPHKKVVFHTQSQGSAVEWPLEKYIALAEILVQKGYRIYFTGTEKEGLQFREALPEHSEIIDLSGKSSLRELIAFISRCDSLVACSTGPLHLAAILGIQAIGLYVDIRPIHPGRWQPLGEKSRVITPQDSTKEKSKGIDNIDINQVLQAILINR